MYLRFISPMRTRMSGVNVGIFRASYICEEDLDQPKFLRDAIRVELEWFNEHLDSPAYETFELRPIRGGALKGICWFRSGAKDMIEHAFNLRALMAECGVLIKVQGTRTPGDILYRDKHQIVALPKRCSPTQWG